MDQVGGNLRAAQADSEQTERRYRDLIEGLSTVVWEADVQTFRCSYVSPQAEPMFGYPLEDWLRADFWQRAIHADDFDSVVAACRHATAEAQDHVIEYRVIRADGAVLWVRDFVRILADTGGRPSQLRGVITDITASRDAADALSSSEQRYHSLFDRLPVGLYRTTPDGVLNDANPALATLLGFGSREALLTSNASDFYVDVDDRRRWQRLLDNAAGVVEVDRRLRRADGTIVWVRDTARALRDDVGNVQYYEGALQDVTERVRAEEAVRRSEARFRSLIENASDGVVIIARDGTVQYQSPAVRRILGYAPEETIGTRREDLVHVDDMPAVLAAFSDLRNRPGHSRSVEFRCQHHDGSWRVLHVIGTNLLEDQNVGGYVVNMIDATLHRLLEVELQH